MPGPVASKRGDGSAYADRVHRFLIGVDAASRLDIVQATGLDENQVSYALRILRGQERAFSAGKTNRTRYAVTQEAADAASRAA